MNRFVVRFVMAAAFAACTRNTIDRPKAVVRDSAGIQIVENTEPSWTGEDGWRLGNRPLLDIGDIKGAPNYELYLVSGAGRLPNGRIVMAHRGSGESRFYDSRARHIFNAGRQGAGPGEFEAMGQPRLLAEDSLVVPDGLVQPVSVSTTGFVGVEVNALGKVIGRVVSAHTGQPLPSVTVDVDGTAFTTTTNAAFITTTNADGHFILSLPAGRHTIRARRLGLIPSTIEIQLKEGETYVLPEPIKMSEIPFRLGKLVVTAYADDFEQRRATRRGHFFNREEIVALRPVTASDIFKQVPQLRMKMAVAGRGGSALLRSRNRRGKPPCMPRVLINGFPALPNYVLLPDRIQAVEIYLRWTHVPPEFRQFDHDCEVIVIWTR